MAAALHNGTADFPAAALEAGVAVCNHVEALVASAGHSSGTQDELVHTSAGSLADLRVEIVVGKGNASGRSSGGNLLHEKDLGIRWNLRGVVRVVNVVDSWGKRLVAQESERARNRWVEVLRCRAARWGEWCTSMRWIVMSVVGLERAGLGVKLMTLFFEVIMLDWVWS